MRYKLPILLLIVLTGCMNQSRIQNKYVGQQDECRMQIQSSLPTSGTTADTQASTIGAQFSDCMNKAGWHVPLPKTGGTPPPTQVVQNPPSGSPSTNPHAAAAVAPPPQTASVQNPPSGAPSVNPSAAVASAKVAPQQAATSGPAPATYQPARPIGTPATTYGTGAGRQF